MTKRLIIHQPKPVTKDLESAVKQIVYDLIMAQQKIQVILDEIANKPHLDSFLLEDVELTTGIVNYINHKLNRRIRGFKLCGQNANAVIWEDITVTVDNKKQIALQCSADVTCSIEVF